MDNRVNNQQEPGLRRLEGLAGLADTGTGAGSRVAIGAKEVDDLRPLLQGKAPAEAKVSPHMPKEKPPTEYKQFNTQQQAQARHLLLNDRSFWKEEFKYQKEIPPGTKIEEILDVDKKVIKFLFKDVKTYGACQQEIVEGQLTPAQVKLLEDCKKNPPKDFDGTRFHLTFDTPEKLQKARYAVLHDNRFRKEEFKGKSLNELEGKTLAEVLILDKQTIQALFLTENVKINDQMFHTFSLTKEQEVDPDISNFLIQYMGRKEDKVEINGHTYEQNTRHLEKTTEIDTNKKLSFLGQCYRLVVGTTLSSVAIKDKPYDKEMRDFNANNAVVTGNGNYYCGRSARSDTSGRILENMMSNYISAKNSKNKVGINPDGSFTFSITSGQDRNIFKWLLAKITGGEDELTSVQKIEKSIDAIWGDKPYIIVKDENGKDVRFNRPLFKTQIFSVYSGDKAYCENTRNANMQASLHQEKLLAEKLDEQIQGSTGEAKDILTQLRTQPQDSNSIKVLLLRISRLAPAEKAQVMKYYLALEAVQINKTGKNLAGEVMDGEFDQGKIVLLNMQLNDVLNIAESYQCKSGCDRTLQMVAMKMALVEFEKAHADQGLIFNPLTDLKSSYASLDKNTPSNHREFAGYFQQFAGGLGGSIVNSARGKNQVKWEHQKAVLLFCDPGEGKASANTTAIASLIIDFGARWKLWLANMLIGLGNIKYGFTHKSLADRKVTQIKV